MRQFGLTNEYGESYDLNDVHSGFLHEPKGLGYSFEYSFSRIGNSWTPQYMRDSQQAISGTLIFATNTPYNIEAQFLEFIRKSKKLVLSYETTAGKVYKNVYLVTYDKSEISEGGLLNCGITLMPTSLWYSKVSTIITISGQTPSDAMQFPYRYASRYNANMNGFATIINDGSVDAEFTVDFNGAIVNPVLKVKQNGVELYRLAITGEVSAGEMIKYSSVDGDIYCYKTNNGSKISLMSGLSLDNANFFKLPIGTSEMEISADTPITSPIRVEVRKSYRAI